MVSGWNAVTWLKVINTHAQLHIDVVSRSVSGTIELTSAQRQNIKD